MRSQSPSLDVYCQARPAGRLWLDERRRFVFAYADEWVEAPDAFPLSLSLPLRRDAFTDDAARPFFANLLPEGELRRVIEKRLHVSAQNTFGLLEKIGGDCAGAVSVLPTGKRPQEAPGYRQLDEASLHQVLAELPKRPLLAGDRGVRLSLAGAQNKLPVYIENERVHIATGNSASTHILKPPIAGFRESVENEAFCMTLARRVGMTVADVSVRRNKDIVLIVTRFDRQRGSDGSVRRLHQEDFCQALGLLPEQKYEAEGGPSLAQCFDLIRRYSIRPAADLSSLLDWVVFNATIGNADAHAKNLSLSIGKQGPGLARFYDLLCTEVYPELADKLAMKIGGENRPDWLQKRHWERFAESVAMKPRFVLGRLRDVASRIAGEADALVHSLEQRSELVETASAISELAKKRAARLRSISEQSV